MDFYNEFTDLARSESLIPQLNFYYAYEMLVEGLRLYCERMQINPQWHDEYNQIVDWLKDNNKKGLLVYGDMGTGKSVICRELIPRIINGKWDRLNDEPECYPIDAYDLSHTDTESIVTFGTKYLMIDDIGVEAEYNNFGTRRSIFREIVNLAEKNGILLILTSNLTLDQLKEKYGARTIDRLRALVKPVVFKGASMRNGNDGTQPLPDLSKRAYGIEFESSEEAEEFEQEQNLLRQYYDQFRGDWDKNGLMICEDDRKEWDANLPFCIWKKTLYCIPKHQDTWKKECDRKQDPDWVKCMTENWWD